MTAMWLNANGKVLQLYRCSTYRSLTPSEAVDDVQMKKRVDFEKSVYLTLEVYLLR